MKNHLIKFVMFLGLVSNAYAYEPLSNGELDLYEIYNNLASTSYTSNSYMNILQVNPDDFWKNQGGVVIPVSANAGNSSNVLSYDMGNLSSMTSLFIQGPNQGMLGNGGSNPYKMYAIPNVDIFGMLLSTNNGSSSLLYSSDMEANLGGRDHFVVYQAPQLVGKTYNVIENGVSKTYTLKNPYLVGAEDLDLGDQDYNDIAYVMDSVSQYDPIGSLQNQITNVNNQHTTWNINQDNSINSLNSNVTTLNNNINNVNNVQTIWNQNQDIEINNINQVNNQQTTDINTLTTINNNNTQKLSATNDRVDSLNSRIAELERPQFIVGGVIRLYDSRKWQINTFVDFAVNRQNVDRAGIRFTYKMGKSYEEARLDELEAKLAKVLGENEKLAKESNTEPYLVKNGVGIRSKF